MMTFYAYQRAAIATAPIFETRPDALAILGLGIAGEAGEVADYIKKVLGHGHIFNREKLAKEIGDCLWYCAVLANQIGYSLNEVAQMNADKLQARYPNGFESSRSINRVEDK